MGFLMNFFWEILLFLWLMGIIATIVTRGLVESGEYFLSKEDRIIYNFFAIISIILVGGIPLGGLIGINKVQGVGDVIVIIIVAAIVYVVGCRSLGVFEYAERSDHILLIAVFIISMICWSIPISKYYWNCETTTQTVVQQEERKLMMFNNIPVQNVSGEISGSFTLGSGSISGEITTSDYITYWYLDESGYGVSESALASASKIDFFDDNQSPYVEIIVYSTQRIYKNHNTGTEKTTTVETWSEYIFHLPESIMQYNLN